MKRSRALVFLLLLLVPVFAASEWHTETVDPTVNVGEFSSLAVDSCNRPHISYSTGYSWQLVGGPSPGDDYRPAGSSVLKYARWDGDEWHLTTVDSGGNVGRYNSLVLDSSYHPHISYYDASNADLKYACWDGGQWLIETVDSDGSVGSHTSLVLDDSDHPHISYRGDSLIKYARWDGSNWLMEIVAYGTTPSLALDSSGCPHIAYYNDATDDLKYAHRDGDEWEIETLDSGGDVGSGPSLALDSSGYPHVSYVDRSNQTIKHARWDGVAWQFENVYTATGGYRVSGCSTSLVVDSYGHSRITFCRTHEDDPYFYWSLFYARWNGSTWGTFSVPCGPAGRNSSLALDSYDNPHISFMFRDAYYCDIWLNYTWYGDRSGVESVSLSTEPRSEGVLVGWVITGDTPHRLRVLRELNGEISPLHSGSLPGRATRYLDSDVSPGFLYRYWLEVIEADGLVTRFGPTEAVSLPEAGFALILFEPYPSPAQDVVTLSYTLPNTCSVELAVYDLSGRRVATLVNGIKTAGRHEVSWCCAEIGSGVYLYHLETDAGSLTKRLVVGR